MNRTEIQNAIVAKATEDAAFRQKLIEDPRQAISEIAQIGLPRDLEITVFEESQNRFCLVLPPLPIKELSDADLASISGGGGEKAPADMSNLKLPKKTIRRDVSNPGHHQDI